MLLSFVLSTLLAASIALPGGPPVGMDYLAYDAATTVWVPAGNTGNVDVVDIATGKVTRSTASPPPPRSAPGGRVGPSSATVGDGTVWVGNRGDTRCARSTPRRSTRGACISLPSIPDGLAYVAATKEVWATTPRDQSITVLDARQAPALP